MKGTTATQASPFYRITQAAPPPASPAEDAPAEGPVAILVVHGMGQPVPYETLNSLSHGFLAEARAREPGTTPPDPRPGQTRVGEKDLRYVEIQAKGRPYHLFEAYWAPVTEGKVKFRHVLGFLLGAGTSGLRKSLLGWDRAMFGRLVRNQWNLWHVVLIALILLVIAALAAMTLVILAVNGLKTLPGDAPIEEMEPRYTPLFLGTLGFVALFGAALVAAVLLKAPRRKARRAGWHPALQKALLGVSLLASGASLLALLLALGALFLALVGIVLVLAPGADAVIPDLLARGALGLEALGRGPQGWWGGLLAAGLWAALLAVAAFVGRILVQYLGDVAAYVSPNKLDEFEAVREEIRKRVKETAAAIYARKDADCKPYYARVHVVGHSLGSVAAYDALNALLVDDEIGDAGLGVRDRTGLLLTFGSPLDKTAFFFATRHRADPARELLTLLPQPLLRDYAFRRLTWVNVHSPFDIISGPLHLYDLPGERPAHARPIQNVVDWEADVPLVAHVQYWKNRKVWEVLYQHA